MLSATLTGCTQTKVRDAAAGMEAAETKDAETDNETERNTAFAGAEDGQVFLYSEIAEYGEYCDLYDNGYSPVNEVITANENIKIFNGAGVEIGYIKTGATVDVTEYSNGGWARFKTPIDGTPYDYLYVLKKYVTVEPGLTIKAADLKKRITDDLNKGIVDAENIKYTVIDTPTSDMEVYEFRMESSYDDELDYGHWYDKNLNWDSDVLFNYLTYSIYCVDDTDGWISCKVYYKDKIDWSKYPVYPGANNQSAQAAAADNQPSQTPAVNDEPAPNPAPQASEETPAASDKYTPEECIAVYRSIMEGGGIIWDPSLKDGGSWGSGFMYLEKGVVEREAKSSLESFAMGNGGMPWTRYYLEVTGSDEDCVYATAWHN